MSAKLTDPAGLARVAALLAPALTQKAPAPLKADAKEVRRVSDATTARAA